MGKYFGGLTSRQVCALECKEVNAILRKHRVPRAARHAVIDAIREGWHQFQMSNEFHKHFIGFICRHFETSEEELTKLFFRYENEEIRKNWQKRGRGE